MELRDYFAAHAPNDCSDWLIGWQFDEPEPQQPEGYSYYHKGGSANREELSKAVADYETEHASWRTRRIAAQATAARWAYADTMLAEREKAKP